MPNLTMTNNSNFMGQLWHHFCLTNCFIFPPYQFSNASIFFFSCFITHFLGTTCPIKISQMQKKTCNFHQNSISIFSGLFATKNAQQPKNMVQRQRTWAQISLDTLNKIFQIIWLKLLKLHHLLRSLSRQGMHPSHVPALISTIAE